MSKKVVPNTLEELIQATRARRQAAQARLGERDVTCVLLRMRMRLSMLSELCYSAANDEPLELSQDALIGLADALEDVKHDLEMIEDVLPAEIMNWQPGTADEVAR